jgi:protein transport protein SEC23
MPVDLLAHAHLQGPSVAEVEVGVGGTTAWKLATIDNTTTVAAYFEVAQAAQGSAAQRAFFQFVTYYQHPSGHVSVHVAIVSCVY